MARGCPGIFSNWLSHTGVQEYFQIEGAEGDEEDEDDEDDEDDEGDEGADVAAIYIFSYG